MKGLHLYHIQSHRLKTAILEELLPACIKSVEIIKKKKVYSMRRKEVEKDTQLQICAIIYEKEEKSEGRLKGRGDRDKAT